MADRVIPLFPLDLVLFPGMVLPLRIFEPRYRLMVERCLAGDRQFGIALLQPKEDEDDAREVPHATGTLAEIGEVEVQDDGDLMLSCVGLRRFHIERQIEGEPYAQVEISLIEEGDPSDHVDERLLEESARSLEEYLESLTAITNITVALPDEELSPIDLSYLMSATLQVDNEMKQELLELPDAAQRLERVNELFRVENDEIQQFLLKSRNRGDFYYRGRRFSMN